MSQYINNYVQSIWTHQIAHNNGLPHTDAITIKQKNQLLNTRCWSRQLIHVNRTEYQTKIYKCTNLLKISNNQINKLSYNEAIQIFHFKDEVSSLKGGTIVHCNSKLFGLCPIVDDNGGMQVGVRLDHASIPSYIEKYPIVMSRAKDCKVSKLIITHYHEKFLHQGRVVTVNTIGSNGFCNGF